ncbi:MAG: sensor histidine kinase [Planctomycetota bacterium]
MSQLGPLLQQQRNTIVPLLDEKLRRADCRRLQGIGDGAAAALVDLLVTVVQSRRSEAATRWAAELLRDGGAQGLSLREVFSALNCLQRSARLLVVRHTSGKRQLVEVLSEIDYGVELLRQACLAIVHRDQGRTRELEEALAESERRKRAVLESALDAIITIDSAGRITEFNRAAEQLFGYPRTQVLGTRPEDLLFPPASTPEHQERIDRYLAAGEGSMLGRRIEVTASRASGESFPAEMAMTLSQRQGEPVLTLFMRDISHRKQAEEEQQLYAAELERSNRELEQFAYVASHDLQEPLRKIRTFGDRLESNCREQLDELGQECIDRMQSAAARMQMLIEGLLTLSRVTTRGQNFVPVDLAQVAHEVVGDLESQIERSGGRVEVGKLPTIEADPLQMRQLLQNLIGNALKFHRDEEPPVVQVHGRFVHGRSHRTSTALEQCRLVVEDNGIGFEAKYQERIFGVFQRLHSRDVFEGTGIGLAICRRIAERHGGTISATSVPGSGSTFEVVLPVRQTKRKKTAPAAETSIEP